jgi:GNAT superfamily N-acetyltransferase
VLIQRRPATDPELVALVAALDWELRERERASSTSSGSGADPVSDTARYLVAVLDGRVVGCGAVQTLDEATGEIKRMYVRPAYRGRGISRQLLAALEEMAWSSGQYVLRLEIGEFMIEAIKLFASSGYAPISAYGRYVGNPHGVCFEKHLPSAL